jgi:hypothetical protein
MDKIKDSKETENKPELYTVLGVVKDPIIIPLKRFEKSKFIEELQWKIKKYIEHTIWDDVEQTYTEAMCKYARTDIKINTNLLEPQIYKFAANEVEIVNYA